MSSQSFGNFFSIDVEINGNYDYPYDSVKEIGIVKLNLFTLKYEPVFFAFCNDNNLNNIAYQVSELIQDDPYSTK